MNCSSVLPEWFIQKLPDVKKCGYLGYDEQEELFWVKKEERKDLIFSLSLSEIYEECQKNGNNLKLDNSIKENFKVINDSVVYHDNNVYFFSNDASKVEKLEKTWLEWLRHVNVFTDDNNWQSAYKIIELFPLCWRTRYGNEKSFEWTTDEGHEHIKHFLNKGKISLDMYVPEYEDTIVSTENDNFEDGYINIAKSLLAHFDCVNCCLNN